MPQTVTSCAVRSYRTLSPLPEKLAVYSLLHFPYAHAPLPLAGVLPNGARTFLYSSDPKIALQRLPG